MEASLAALADTLQETLAKVDQERVTLQRAREIMRAEKRAAEKETADLRMERTKVAEERQEVDRLRHALEDEKEYMASLMADQNDLISLNMGGERVVTVKRSLLTQFDQSMLARMFSGRHDDKLDRDKDGNVFLDYSPSVMMPLIDFLRLHRDRPQSRNGLELVPPECQDAYTSMVGFLGLDFLVAYTFSGIQQQVQIDDLYGWTLIFSANYKHWTSLSDFEPPEKMRGGALLVGARRVGSNILTLAAMGNAEAITLPTKVNQTHLHNGVYWYCCQGKSIGFSPRADVKMNAADMQDTDCTARLSWHLTDYGGWRAGSACDLHTCEDWEKVIFAAPLKIVD